MKNFLIISILLSSVLTGQQVVFSQPGTSSPDTLPKPDSLSCGLLNYEGQVYHTVKIGGQCWMSENLNVGKWIDQSQLQKQSDNGVIEKYCYGNNFVQCDFWGGLYQWEEVMGYSQAAGVQGICPQGWHVPSSQDWKSLIRYLGGDDEAGGKLKSTLQWQMPNVGANNSSGFSAYPGGYFDYMAQNWHDMYEQGYYWTSEIITKGTAVAVNLFSRTGAVDMYEEYQPSALSVRCVKY